MIGSPRAHRWSAAVGLLLVSLCLLVPPHCCRADDGEDAPVVAHNEDELRRLISEGAGQGPTTIVLHGRQVDAAGGDDVLLWLSEIESAIELPWVSEPTLSTPVPDRIITRLPVGAREALYTQALFPWRPFIRMEAAGSASNASNASNSTSTSPGTTLTSLLSDGLKGRLMELQAKHRNFFSITSPIVIPSDTTVILKGYTNSSTSTSRDSSGRDPTDTIQHETASPFLSASFARQFIFETIDATPTIAFCNYTREPMFIVERGATLVLEDIVITGCNDTTVMVFQEESRGNLTRVHLTGNGDAEVVLEQRLATTASTTYSTVTTGILAMPLVNITITGCMFYANIGIGATLYASSLSTNVELVRSIVAENIGCQSLFSLIGSSSDETAQVMTLSATNSGFLANSIIGYEINTESDSAIISSIKSGLVSLASVIVANNTGIAAVFLFSSSLYEDKTTTAILESHFQSNLGLSMTKSRSGGLFNFQGGLSVMVNSSFVLNQAYSSGTVALMTLSSIAIVYGCEFRRNTASVYGGGFALLDESRLSITQSNFAENNSSCGSVVAAIGASVYIELVDTIMAGNYAGCGGCIYAVDGGSVEVTGSQFYNSQALSGGVAAISGSADLQMHNCVVYESSCGGSGGVFHLSQAATVTLEYCTFTGNFASLGGIAWMSEISTLVATSCNFTLNYGVLAGGLFSMEGYSFTSLSKCTVDTNYALTKSGGIVVLSDQSVFATELSTFESNMAVSGSIISAQDLVTCVISECTFANNFALLNGGLIVSDSTTASVFPNVHPTADSLSALSEMFLPFLDSQGYVRPVEIAKFHSSFRIIACHFVNNSALGGDGGIAALVNTDLVVILSVFENNRASRSGGCVSFTSFSSTDSRIDDVLPSLIVVNSSFVANAASESGGVVAIPELSFSPRNISIIVFGCEFLGNRADRGGVLFSNTVFTKGNETFGEDDLYVNNTALLYGDDYATVVSQVIFFDATTSVTISSGQSVMIGQVSIQDSYNQTVILPSSIAGSITMAVFNANLTTQNVSALLLQLTPLVVNSGFATFGQKLFFGLPGEYCIVPKVYDGVTTQFYMQNIIKVTVLPCNLPKVSFYNDDSEFPRCLSVDEMSSASVAVFECVAALGFLFVFFVAVSLWRFQDQKIVQVAGFKWCAVLLFMCLNANVVLLVSLRTKTEVSCSILNWLGHIVFMIVLGILLSKFRTSHQLSDSVIRNLELTIRDQHLFVHVMVPFLFACVYLAVWNSSSAFVVEDNLQDDVTVAKKCYLGHNAWQYVFYGIEAMIILLCNYFIFKTRDVTTLFNEAKYLTVVVWSSTLHVIVSCIIIAAETSIQASLETFLQVLIWALWTVSILLAVFLPKVYSIYTSSWKGSGDGREAVVSYCFEDRSFMKRVVNGLAQYGISAWYDDMRLEATSYRRKEVAQTIRASHGLIFIVSRKSVATLYCLEEVQFAYDLGITIYPIIKDRDFTENLDPGLDMLLKRFQWMFFTEAEDEEAEGGLAASLARGAAALTGATHRRVFDEQLEKLANVLVRNLQSQTSAPGSAGTTIHTTTAGGSRLSASSSSATGNGDDVSKKNPLAKVLHDFRVAHGYKPRHSKPHAVDSGLAANLRPKDVFISWAHSDADFVKERLWPDLEMRKVDCWIDFLQLQAGENWRKAIGSAIKGCSTVLFVLTPASFTSQYCQEELLYAHRCGKRIVVVVWKSPKRAMDDIPDMKNVIDKSQQVDFSDAELYSININMLSLLLLQSDADVHDAVQKTATGAGVSDDRHPSQPAPGSRHASAMSSRVSSAVSSPTATSTSFSTAAAFVQIPMPSDSAASSPLASPAPPTTPATLGTPAESNGDLATRNDDDDDDDDFVRVSADLDLFEFGKKLAEERKLRRDPHPHRSRYGRIFNFNASFVRRSRNEPKGALGVQTSQQDLSGLRPNAAHEVLGKRPLGRSSSDQTDGKTRREHFDALELTVMNGVSEGAANKDALPTVVVASEHDTEVAGFAYLESSL